MLTLYSSVIQTTMGAVEDHMAHRQALDPAASATVFENALWLYRQASTVR